MDPTTIRATASITIAANADELYAFIADMPRMGEISPECTGGTWQNDDRGVGAVFIGTNASPERSWERHLKVAVANPPQEYAWENYGDAALPVADDETPSARWTYTFTPVHGGTKVVETWGVYPRLEALGEERLSAIQTRFQAGIEVTLKNLKELFEV